MSKIVEMTGVVTLKLKTRTIGGTSRQDFLNILESVLEYQISTILQVLAFSVMFKVAVAFEHRIEPKIH